ncbi:uncharacterized protein [Rutidosis leptorrhynchoides]|uniref:uncharacterized protein n=1 Tax=Rutidosis leptorrhynchoides TaxID=125765 RepID=UPI003A99DC0E
MESWISKSIHSFITMAISDFYELNSNYRTRIVIHTRDSGGKPLQALSAVLDLLNNIKVKAIIGPETYLEANLLAPVSDNSKVPIFTFAGSSSMDYPYLFQIKEDESDLSKTITALVVSYKWKDIIYLYEDVHYWREMLSYLLESLQYKNIHVGHTSAVPASATDDQIIQELQIIKISQTSVVIVHMSSSLAYRVLLIAKSLGMVSEKNAWIVTYKSIDILQTENNEIIESMEGIIGLRSYIPSSSKLLNLTARLHNEFSLREVNVLSVWAYDTIWALAESIERLGTKFSFNTTQIDSIILNELSRTKFKGLSGEFRLINGKLASNGFKIVNVKANVETGDSKITPKRRILQTVTNKTLKVGVLSRRVFNYFIDTHFNNQTNVTTATGFSVDVFNACINGLPYEVPYELIPYADGTYDDLIKKVYDQEIDAILGDSTILENRSQYVDFTATYTDLGEIWDALQGCDSSKAPGPDGFNMKFLKKYWWLVKEDLTAALDWFWLHSEISKGCNASFFTLIPKKSNPIGFNEYRPICLIGCYYKILTKLLSNRLAKIIHKIIGSEQTAFLKGRNILDSVLIANEIIDELKRKKQKGLIFKVDFEKAFDCIEWDFLFNTMKSLGFGIKWISFIKACLSSSTISILINGSPTREFTPGRGIRQGDPISPFLFIIAAEGLNILVKRAITKNQFRGIRVGHDEIVISHLQYADDTIFFGEWSKRNSKNIAKLLKCFENISGLKVNLKKSSLYGIGVPKPEVEDMAKAIDCSAGSTPFTYLGLPIGVPSTKASSWHPIIEKFEKRLSDWKAKTISYGGRLTLIKSVLSSLPLYYFSLFHAPTKVINSLEAIRRKFFWGGSESNNKINWIKWELILSPYDKGGLNIGSLFCKNISLLCKWWWRFHNEKTALWVKIISSIYGAGGGICTNDFSRKVSGRTIWNEIIKAGKIADNIGISFSSSINKCIGNGSNTKFWTDIWCGTEPLNNLFRRLYMLDSNKNASVADRLTLSNTITHGSWAWTRTPTGRGLRELTELNNLISSISLTEAPDSWKWNLDPSGSFSTKMLSHILDNLKLATSHSSTPTPRNKFLPQKICIFIWRVINGRIPTRSELDKRNIDLDSILCPICEAQIESIDHILFLCPKTTQIWSSILQWWKLPNNLLTNFSDITSINQNLSSNQTGTLARINQNDMWIFLRPLDVDLWLSTICFAMLTGIAIVAIESMHQGSLRSPTQQIGATFWFILMTLFFTQREKLASNLAKFVAFVWLSVVLILISSYTATLASLLTVEQFEFASKGGTVGFHGGSFVSGVIVENYNFEDYRHRPYYSYEAYADALSKGGKHGGADAIVDEVPYIKMFLGRHSSDYAMLSSEPITSGFAFIFQKGSPLVRDVSRQIAKIRENRTLERIEKEWFEKESSSSQDLPTNPKTLNFGRFRGLFLISGISSAFALMISVILSICAKLEIHNVISFVLQHNLLANLRHLLHRNVIRI